MNVYDGERMAELLGATGMTAIPDGEEADLVVLNTCHIREKAAEKAYSDVGRLRREDGSKPLIALAGCVAQAEGAEARRRSPLIDIVVGPQSYHRLPEMIAEASRGERPVDTDMPATAKFDALPARRRAAPSAFLTVQEGCDKFCTYCVVPYTRGAEISRPSSDIVAEAHSLVDAGALEIVLLELAECVVEGESRVERMERRLGDLAGSRRSWVATFRDNFADERLASDHSDEFRIVADKYGAHRRVGQALARFLSARTRVERSRLRHHRIANVLRHG